MCREGKHAKESTKGGKRREHGNQLKIGEQKEGARGRREGKKGKKAQGGTAIPAQMRGLEGGRPDRLVKRHVHAARTLN